VKDLDPAAIDCLRRIAQGQPYGSTPCAAQLLTRLESLQLIERAPRLWLPWELGRYGYRLTPLGETVLQRR